jgi:hypothetical protein
MKMHPARHAKTPVVPAEKIDAITEALVQGPRTDASVARRAAERAASDVPRIGLKRAAVAGSAKSS